jgi:hypothetical protein
MALLVVPKSRPMASDMVDRDIATVTRCKSAADVGQGLASHFESVAVAPARLEDV